LKNRFHNHDLRPVISLDGTWDFAFLGDVFADDVELTNILFDDYMSIPGCFDAAPKYAGKRGLVAYRTTAMLSQAGHHRLVFEAVNHWCRVFVNGQLAREKSGGFTSFYVDFCEQPGSIEIIVLVDNRLDNGCSVLHLAYYDWYHYGGICRPVALHYLGDQWIESVQVSTHKLEPPTIQVQVTYGNHGHPIEKELKMKIGDQTLLDDQVMLESGQDVIERMIPLEQAALWSPGAPNLHALQIQLGQDVLQTRFGIRQVQIDGGQIKINGEAIRLLGFNRHESHPQFGHALPQSLIMNDIQQLLDLGCNFVRGSHYPQDPRFLDLCDQVGICVWVEATGWQQTAEHLTDSTYLDAQLMNVEEMVSAAFNHPSVIMWGALNEGRSDDPLCVAGYTAVLNRIRQLDASRPVTYASNHILTGDLCLHLADLISINAYPGWYQGEIEDIPKILDELFAQANAIAAENKPIIVSEIGAGAIPGWRDQHETRWTEQYQARLLKTVIEHLFFTRNRAAGLAIWQFCDIRSSELAGRILGRPRGFNNKGVVDEYRRPKLAYDMVKNLFQTLSAPSK
jgi:beta-glucuronidase